jgi:hypothetical protein
MIINLLPDFLAVLKAQDRVAAYHAYFERHRSLLSAYWDNYVVDPTGPHFEEVVGATVAAGRADLHTLLSSVDVVTLAERTVQRVSALLEPEYDMDVVLMVGVGAANAGELVVDGRGIAFVCLEHFTGDLNPDTQGLGLEPELLPMWLAHEMAHVVRYTAEGSRSQMRRLVHEAGGYYSYWDTGRLATLRELLVNEGLAIQVSRAVSPGHAPWEYLGYSRKQYAEVREVAPVLARALTPDLDRAGLGLRLRYLLGGMSEEARTVERTVIPERSGYYVGARLAAPAIDVHGHAWSIRASAEDIADVAAGQLVPNTTPIVQFA